MSMPGSLGSPLIPVVMVLDVAGFLVTGTRRTWHKFRHGYPREDYLVKMLCDIAGRDVVDLHSARSLAEAEFIFKSRILGRAAEKLHLKFSFLRDEEKNFEYHKAAERTGDNVKLWQQYQQILKGNPRLEQADFFLACMTDATVDRRNGFETYRAKWKGPSIPAEPR